MAFEINMTQKLTYYATETLIGNDSTIPKSIRDEIILFAKRNIISGDEFCPRCLKAHLIKKAKQRKISASDVLAVALSPDCEEGHHGYYMDGEDIIKI